MKQFPVLTTPRLVLRPFTLDDAPAVQRLASAREVAEGTLTIPHPYPDGAAAEWIATHPARFEEEKDLVLAITVRETGEVAGAMGLILKLDHDKVELGYWVGVPFWGRGYATEAARAMIRYGLEEWPLHRIEAFHFSRNPASGRVMQKLGLRHEGTLRGETKKWGEYLDIEVYGALRGELLP
jgi:RimJ/RimL family protein N-acetyltransferase